MKIEITLGVIILFIIEMVEHQHVTTKIALENIYYLFHNLSNLRIILGNGGIPLNVHAHEHLLDKRMMHMHIP